ncbi:CYTH domain-containing protein [Pararhizobium sp.]|uniref:CYTH domain-containing protein n=1 Tax=Pararhizobium sp. TaxID=1977563 RepID=UPI00271CED4F|nr:CYTH domain-containing protein [Pararhizobium sp.]MDO9415259.1 CYTH domain-containing protein [Pararhizobium sp.]
MAKEIERKFLVASDGWRAAADDGATLRQAYIAAMEDRSVRVRIKNDNSARMTVKIGRNALVRDEFEYDIPLPDAEELCALAIGIVIRKTRYRVSHEGFVWEVDVYDGAYSGLVVAEVEMRSADDDPSLPDWLGVEVTGDHRYSNQSLATEALEIEAGGLLRINNEGAGI